MADFQTTLAGNSELTVFNGLMNAVLPDQLATVDRTHGIHTILAGSDSAFIRLAQSLGFTGVGASDAQSFLLATLSTSEIESILKLGFLEGTYTVSESRFTAAGQDGVKISYNRGAYSDQDDDTPDAYVTMGDIAVDSNSTGERFVQVLSEVLLPTDLTGNDGYVWPDAPGAPTVGDDTLTGNDFAQSIDLMDGNDVYDAMGGSDVVQAGKGDDTIRGGAGSDRITGQGGNDWIGGGDDADELLAGGGDDIARGNKGNDLIKGGGGQDVVAGGPGNDRVSGGNGSDKVKGDSGNDTLSGGDGDDLLVEGEGDGFLDGGRGDDRMRGDLGRDTFLFQAGSGNDVITDFEDGLDMLDLTALNLTGIGDLKITPDGGATIIEIDPLTTIRLRSFSTDDLTEADFIF